MSDELYKVKLIPKVAKQFSLIREQAKVLIDRIFSKDITKNKIEVLKSLRKKNPIVDSMYNIEELIMVLEQDKPRPAHIASKNGEIISDINYKINNQAVNLHHGHIKLNGKLNTVYWIYSPVNKRIIIILLSEEHPKTSRGYSKRELLKKLPKNIPDDFFNDLQTDNNSENNETNSLYINSIGELTLKVRNQNNKLFIYEDSLNKKYLFIKTSRENQYIFTRLFNKDLRLIFFRNFSKDSDKPNISSILSRHRKHLNLLMDKEVRKISFSELTRFIPDYQNLYFYPIKENIINLIEMLFYFKRDLFYELGFIDGFNSIKRKFI